MKFPVSTALILFLVFFYSCTADSSTSQCSQKQDTELMASLDGTVYLTESASGRVIWSFSTGSPIYHSYQYHAPIHPHNTNNASSFISSFIECGDDWELILHDAHFGQKKLSKSISDYVASTLTETEDGAMILASQRHTLFDVNAETGSVVYSDFDNGSSKLNNTPEPEFLLRIIRKDYLLESVGSKSIMWTMTVAEFKARLLCQHNENVWGLDFAMPYACDGKLKDVYRQRKNA